MSVEERIELLRRENERLKQDNEMMRKIIVQMRGTLNRTIRRYITASGSQE